MHDKRQTASVTRWRQAAIRAATGLVVGSGMVTPVPPSEPSLLKHTANEG